MDKANNNFKEARFYHLLPDGSKKIKCELCPQSCVISPDSSGFCKVRHNFSGKLYSLVYGYPTALQIDPIEKKPFAEYLNGTTTFSIGTYGCNLDCQFCQNYHLSCGKPSLDVSRKDFISPVRIVDNAVKNKCRSVAFTYNEPSIWVEYAADIALRARENNLSSVLISNGFINRAAAEEFYPLIDAANIDMKGFSEEFYSDLTKGRLSTVLESIKLLYSLNKHIEITNLVIPGKNDSDQIIRGFLEWVDVNLDKNVPLHFSAFFPAYKLKNVPPTPAAKLYEIRDHAISMGFTSVYLGNV
ncbi:MAG: AmmeMemoRadiSam system radical SAM enzyme [Victivallales bacterium]|nr:AmmeMemoRadiSam system radical SAM enzyme [Victivallales bacterium]